MSLLDRIKLIEDALKAIMLLLEQNKEKLDRLLVMKPMIAVMDSPKEEPVVIEKTIIKGGTTVPKSEGIDLDLEYNGRQYKGKWVPCKFKCGALTSWPADYKKGDQKLHVHPIDKEILGFAQEYMNGNFKCPMVVKK